MVADSDLAVRPHPSATDDRRDDQVSTQRTATLTFGLSAVAAEANAAATSAPSAHHLAPDGPLITAHGSYSAGVNSSPPSNLANYGGQLHVLTAASDGSVTHKWYGNGAWHTENLGGLITGTPAVVVYNNTFHVIATSNDGYVYDRSYDGTAWTFWAIISAGVNPTATTYAGQLHVFAETDSGINHAWTGGGQWYGQQI